MTFQETKQGLEKTTPSSFHSLSRKHRLVSHPLRLSLRVKYHQFDGLYLSTAAHPVPLFSHFFTFPHKLQCLAVKIYGKNRKKSPPPLSKFLSHIEKILQSTRALLSYVWASTSTFRFVHVLSCQGGKGK